MNRLYTSPKDNFSWWIVTDIAEEIFCVEKIELYALHDDESDSLLESIEEIEEAKKMGMRIGMELGYIKPNPSLWGKCERFLKNGHWFVKLSDVTKQLGVYGKNN